MTASLKYPEGRRSATLADLTSSAGRACTCTYRIGLTPPEDDRIFLLKVTARGRRLPHTHRVQHLSDAERSIRMARAPIVLSWAAVAGADAYSVMRGRRSRRERLRSVLREQHGADVLRSRATRQWWAVHVPRAGAESHLRDRLARVRRERGAAHEPRRRGLRAGHLRRARDRVRDARVGHHDRGDAPRHTNGEQPGRVDRGSAAVTVRGSTTDSTPARQLRTRLPSKRCWVRSTAPDYS